MFAETEERRVAASRLVNRVMIVDGGGFAEKQKEGGEERDKRSLEKMGLKGEGWHVGLYIFKTNNGSEFSLM